MSLKGRRAIVTGASGGVGRVVVRRFLDEGMKVVGVVRRRPERVEARVEGLVVMEADVTREEDVKRLFADAVKHLGGLDILVNGVGGFIPARPVADLSLEDWESMMRVNLLSVFLCTREALKVMKGTGYGRIVNFSAQTALRPVAGRAPYAVSKAAVSIFTEIVSKEVRNDGITINAIAPSIIDTDANRKSMPEEDFSKWIPPEKIAETICSLCSARSAISGTTLRAFGGLQ